jgi:lipopolysaccharide/colanic/teichoic acid biosynthesis glycosyltransferase
MNAGGRKYDELVPYYAQRLQMRPGLTGWAQCNGLRGSTEDEGVARARVDHDIAYVQNFSLALDFRILANTVAREFLSGTGH